MLYFDASALVKLVASEPETEALRGYLSQRPDMPRFSSMLVQAELLRTARRGGPKAVVTARRVLTSFYLVDVTRDVLERAGMVDAGAGLRTLDAIHLVTAATAEERLTAVVTYDLRMAQAAEAMGFAVAAP